MLSLSLSLINDIIFLKKFSGRTHMSIEQSPVRKLVTAYTQRIPWNIWNFMKIFKNHFIRGSKLLWQEIMFLFFSGHILLFGI